MLTEKVTNISNVCMCVFFSPCNFFKKLARISGIKFNPKIERMSILCRIIFTNFQLLANFFTWI